MKKSKKKVVKTNGLNKSEVDYFIQCVEDYSGALGLNGWEINVGVGDLHNGHRAEARMNLKNRCADIVIDRKLDGVSDRRKEIKLCALHECLEILLAPMGEMASEHKYTDSDWERESHIVIRTLEKLL